MIRGIRDRAACVWRVQEAFERPLALWRLRSAEFLGESDEKPLRY